MAKDKKTIKYEADISGFKSNIQEAESKIKTLNNQLKLNQAQLKGNSNSIELLGQRVEQLKEKYKEQTTVVENTRKEYEKAVEVYGENSTEAENLKNKLIQAETKQQSISNAIKETNNQLTLQSEKFITAGAKMQSFGDRATKIGDGLNKIGSKLSIISTGIATLAGATIKASVNYESAWTGVTKTVDGTEEQMSQLREGILELSTQLPTAATEIAGVAENAGQLGIQTDNVLSFSKAMIDLGNSTNLTADEASSQLAKFANIMNMSQKDFEKLGSAIVDLGNNYATTEADIVNMAMRLAGAGHQVGMSEGQVLGLATALSSVGIEAEMGGSAISKAMVKMQNAVEQGGTKLDDVLKKTGMSLRDLELLSTNNSKDFKALADDIGMTSTELQQLIVAGTNLEDFAKVSGMTAEQFKKAWKEDASGALSAFIKGLGDAENKGDSAITMLSEMGLTEVRLRDSLLRAANAGDLFNNAIKTGTKAWDENVALTNEASKRYETTESKLQMLKNEIVKNGIALGDELKPALIEVLEEVKPMVSSITGMVKSFNNLSSTTKKNVINFGTMVIALGPAVKIGGKLISTVGNMATGYGKLVKIVGEWSNKIKIATTTEVLATTTKRAQTVATTASTLATKTNTGALKLQTVATTGATIATKLLKVAMVALPIVGVVAGIASLVSMYSEMNDETTQTNNKIKEQKEEMEQLRAQQQKEMEGNLAQIDNVQRLKNELATLVDENGKVKDGYQTRVDFILGELNGALGTEYKRTGEIIEKYNELSGSIDNLILKKKANIILETQEERYKTAINEKVSATETLAQKQEELVNKQKELATAKEKLVELDGKEDDDSRWETLRLRTKIKRYEEEEQALKETCNEQSKIIQQNINDITNYETNAALVAEGTEESLKKVTDSINYNQQEVSNNTAVALQTQITNSSTYLKQLKDNYEKTGNEITKKQMEEEQKRLEGLVENLKQQTSATGEMGIDVISAWKKMAETSYDEYSKAILNMEPDMQRRVQEVTGIIVNGTPYAGQVANEFGNTVVEKLDKDSEFKQKAINSLSSYLAGLTDEEKRELLKQAGVQDVDKVIEGLNAGEKLSEDKGVEILKGLGSGLQNPSWQNSLFGIAGDLAAKLTKKLTIFATIDTSKVYSNAAKAGLLPGHKNGLDYVPYDNYVARLHKGERVLTAEENRAYMNENINNKLVTRSIVINFYPQSMSEIEMKRTLDYVDRRLGKIY